MLWCDLKIYPSVSGFINGKDLSDGLVGCSKELDWISVVTVSDERMIEKVSRLLLSRDRPLLDFFFGPPKMLILLCRSQNAHGSKNGRSVMRTEIHASGRKYARQKKKPCTVLLCNVVFAPPACTADPRKRKASPTSILAETASSNLGNLECSHR